MIQLFIMQATFISNINNRMKTERCIFSYNPYCLFSKQFSNNFFNICNVYVVVIFLSQVIFIFLLF